MRTVAMPQGSFQGPRNSQGNTILGVLCLIAASVAAFQISYSDSLAVHSGIKNSRILSARDALEARVKSYSSMAATFRSSMYKGLPVTVNSELRNCVFGTGSTPCKANTKMSVALYYPIYTDSAANESLKRMSGPGTDDLPESESAFYDNKGNLCLPNSAGSIDPNCAFFEVRTSFVATCAAGASSCATADTITVNYLIKATTLAGSASQKMGNVPMATIDLSASEVSVLDILPPKPGASANNVTISLLQTVTTLSLDLITSTLKSLGMKDAKKIEEMALAFQQSGVTDLSKLEFAAKAGHADPAWIKLVADSGITNLILARELYWAKKTWTPELLAAVANAVADVKVPHVMYAIAEQQVTDKTVADNMAKAVSAVSNPNVAAGIITGGHYSDAEKVQKISEAVSHIQDPYAEYMAEAGIQDKSTADQILNIVSVITNPYGTGWIIVSGGGDVDKTQAIVTKSLSSSSSSSETPATTTAAATPAPAPTPTPPPVEISLMPTCSSCAPLTY